MDATVFADVLAGTRRFVREASMAFRVHARVPVERFYRDARLFRIYEGTSQIHQVIIAKALLGEAARDHT